MASRVTLNRLSHSLRPRIVRTSPLPRLIPQPATRVSPSIAIRTMASSAPQNEGKYEFLVVVPDKPGMLQKRLEVRPQHFAGLKKFMEDGSFKMGGAILNSVPKDDKPESLDFAGSTLVCISDSVETVRENLSKDIYATTGVWDMDKVQIYPLKCAFRHE